jgi:hypothetical protein
VTVPGYSLQTVRSQYKDEIVDLAGMIQPKNAQEMRTLVDAWRRAILAHPEAYLEHRWFVTQRFLGISNPAHLPYYYGIPQFLYPAYIQNTAYYLRFPSTKVRKWEARWLSLEEYWAFRHWIYISLAIVILFLCRRSDRTPFWLCLSGLSYWLPDFFILPSTDFRYGWWGVLSVTTALALLAVQAFAQLQKRELEYTARFHGGSRKEVTINELARR